MEQKKCQKHNLYHYEGCPKCTEESGKITTEYSYIGVETEEEHIERIVFWAQVSPFMERIKNVMSSAITSYHYVPVDLRKEMVERAEIILKDGYYIALQKSEKGKMMENAEKVIAENPNLKDKG